MPLTFYHVPYSTSNVTSAVLAELEHGVPSPLHERVTLSIQAGDTKDPHYLATVNPNGRVPAIVHDGVPIWESAAITIYLGETFGVDRDLYPALGPKRGEAMKWIVWAATTLAAAAGKVAEAMPAGTAGGTEEGSQDVKPEKQGSAGNLEKAKEQLGKSLKVLEGGLEGREYLLGERYSLADTHIWSLVGWLMVMGTDMGPYKNVKEWSSRVGGRPALKGERL